MWRFFFLFFSTICLAQEATTFTLPDGVDKLKIKFELVSNMIVLPVVVNGVEMSFTLDSGASHTSILNLTGVDSLLVNKGNAVKVNGYGKGKYLQAIYSIDNHLDIQGFNSPHANLYILTEEEISLAPITGREVNGVLGADFFTSHIVEINFEKSVINIYRNIEEVPGYKKRNPIELTFKQNKPRTTIALAHDSGYKQLDALIDTGSGDSVWVFGVMDGFDLLVTTFDDYLGLGVNGEVYGKRTKVNTAGLSNFNFNKITTAFPDREVLDDQYVYDGSSGAIENEVLRRFHLVFDYGAKILYLRKNKFYTDGFYYNMLGITVKEGEKDLITDIIANNVPDKREGRSLTIFNSNARNKMVYQYVSKIIVAYVNPGSLAAQAGIKEGDEIIKFNNKGKGRFDLNDLHRYIYNKPYSRINITIQRDDKHMAREFYLKPIIE
ncbi:MAG: PDZ domain-containing protein [Nonlabens sp.]